jgi:hypothetical protein
VAHAEVMESIRLFGKQVIPISVPNTRWRTHPSDGRCLLQDPRSWSIIIAWPPPYGVPGGIAP